MTSADAMRASDNDRERIVAALQEQVGEGRLTLAEFEERSATAYESKTVGELRALMHDLPVDPLAPPLMPWQQPLGMPPVPPWAVGTDYRRPMVPPQSFPPGRRGNGTSAVGVALLVLLALIVVQGLAALPVLFLLWPLLVILFIVRPGRRFR